MHICLNYSCCVEPLQTFYGFALCSVLESRLQLYNDDDDDDNDDDEDDDDDVCDRGEAVQVPDVHLQLRPEQ